MATCRYLTTSPRFRITHEDVFNPDGGTERNASLPQGFPFNSRACLRPMRVQTVATRGLCWFIALLHLVATHELWIEPLPVNRH